MMGSPSPSASAREAKAVTDVVDAYVVQSGPRADALPRPLDVGHVRARLGARNDPGIVRVARQGREHFHRRWREVVLFGGGIGRR